MNIKNFSLKDKFILVTTINSVVLVVFGLFVVFMINQLADISSAIIDHPLEVSNAAYYANIEVLRMEKDLVELLLVDEAYEINIIVDRIRVSESKVYVALDTIAYEILGDEGKDLQEEARQYFDDWKPIRSEMIEYVREGNREKAYDISKVAGKDYTQDLERKFSELNSYARKKAEFFQENSIELKSDTVRITIIGVSVLFTVIALTLLWISWDVLSGINSLSLSLHDIVKSGEFKNVELERSDELAKLSTIFNELVSSIGTQLWVKEGNRQMNAVLSRDMDFEDKLMSYVEAFHDYGEFLSVAYYHSINNRLSVRAWNNRLGLLDETYELGQGFIGECAMNNKDQWLSYESVIDDYTKVMPYKGLLAKPISVNDMVYGVVAVVFKGKKNSVLEEFIEESLKDFATYIADHTQRNEIDGLLEESNRNNEQLTLRQISLEENTMELEAVNQTLQEQRDLLNDKSEELVGQNRELVDLREELFKKYEDLEEVTAYRSQFLANVSHELRTPLNSIIVLSTMLKNRNTSSECNKEFEKIEVINKAANELLLTINDILDLSKVESGNVEVEEDFFRPNQLMNELKAIYEPLIDHQGLESHFEVMTDQTIYGDRAKISHIITNFISNAVKFTEQGNISVVLRENDDRKYPLRIDVSDTGIGIRDDKFEAIFDEFVQSDGSISRQYGGTGLGLAISKNYATLINAKISLTSTLNVGSTFTLLLPDTAVNHEGKEEQFLEENLKKEDINEQGQLNKLHIGAKVLLCDNEPMNIFAVSAMLEDMGIVPVVAFDYVEVVDILSRDEDINMILMEYMMPETDCITITQELKLSERCQGIPIVIMTAADLPKEALNRIKMNDLQLLHKPINYNQMVDSLNENLSKEIS